MAHCSVLHPYLDFIQENNKQKKHPGPKMDKSTDAFYYRKQMGLKTSSRETDKYKSNIRVSSTFQKMMLYSTVTSAAPLSVCESVTYFGFSARGDSAGVIGSF